MRSFDITHQVNGDCDVLVLSGELDAHTSPHLEEWLQRLIGEKRTSIIVNFKELEYIASAGLGVFMAYIEDIREQGGDIKLTNMSDKIYNVFDLLGFPALYDILADEREAVERFSSLL